MEHKRQVKSDPRRGLPAVARLLRRLREARAELPEWAALDAVRAVLGQEREGLVQAGGARPAPEAELVRRAAERALDRTAHSLRVLFYFFTQQKT